jgi:hypothetical protein
VEIASALLCDAATVREGLLHVLGGAITRLWRPELPAPFGVVLAVVIEATQDELENPHEVHVLIDNVDGRIGEGMGGFQVPRPDRLEPGEHVLLPSVLDLRLAMTASYGKHTLHISVDSEDERDLHFWVLHPDELAIPPLS